MSFLRQASFLASTVALLQCGTPTPSPDGAPSDGSPADVTSAPDASVALDAPSGADVATSDGSPAVDSAAPSDGSTGQMATIGTGICYTFATASGDGSNPCNGDLYTEAGANVDLSAGGAGSSLCLLPGTYTSLAAVPRTYSGCAWMDYIEGGGGLAGQAIYVRDTTGAHVYAMWIQSNTLPSLVFSWEVIN